VNRIFRLPVFLVAILISTLSYAQPSYREGFVVNNSGDTSKGWIDYRQWERNPNAILFKKDLSVAQAQRFAIADLTYFEVTGSDRYFRAVVSKDIRPVQLHEVSETDVDSTVADTVFLRVLLDAKISLYELIDTKPHYYIKETGKDYTELIYKVRVKEGRVQIYPIFQDQLRYLLIAAGKPDNLQALLARTNYKERDLLKATESINRIIYGGNLSYKVEKIKQPVSFYVGAGMVYSTLKYSGDKTFGANLDYSSSFQPLFTGGVDMYIGRNHQRLVLRFDLSWYSLKYEGANHPTIKDTITYNLKLNSFAPSLSILYNVINYPKSKLYIGAGIAYNFSTYPENDYTRKYVLTTHVQKMSPYLDLEEKWISINGKLGYLIANKFEIAAATRVGGQFSNFSGFSLKPSIYNLGVNYHF
jgi:outer membrane protein W